MERSEYDRIVETYLDTVYRAALGFCGSVQDAEDIVQNTFLKLLLKAPEFQDEEHIRRWLLRVAANESNSLWRSFWKKRTVSLDETKELPIFSVREQSDLFAAVLLLMFSNVIAYAATGRTWITALVLDGERTEVILEEHFEEDGTPYYIGRFPE